MKKRKCPCCHKDISRRYFLYRALFKQKSFSFTEKEKGLICKYCNHNILSAEKIFHMTTLPMSISMIPFILYGLSNEPFTFSKFMLILFFSFILLTLLTLKKYYSVQFICNDKSSDAYNSHSIHK